MSIWTISVARNTLFSVLYGIKPYLTEVSLVYYPPNNIRVSFHFVEIYVFNFTLKPIKYNILWIWIDEFKSDLQSFEQQGSQDSECLSTTF